MTVYERLRLELEQPSGDDVYAPRSPYKAGDNFYSPWADDSTTRLKSGAWAQDFEVTNESACAVRVLCLNEPEDVKPYLGSEIVNCVNDCNGQIIGALIVDLGLVDALWGVSEAVKVGFIAGGLADALMHRPRTPTVEELARIVQWAEHAVRTAPEDEVDEWVYDDPTPRQRASRLLRVAKDAQRFRQRQKILRGENPVIDRDRRQLLDRLTSLQISHDVRALLHAADIDAQGGDFKGALEKLRTFLERSFESCCRRFAVYQPSVSLPEGSAGGTIKPWKEYAVRTKLLSNHEAGVFQALSSFLAMEGSHAPASRPEQFHVARATVIEWCLLLSGRCQ